MTVIFFIILKENSNSQELLKLYQNTQLTFSYTFKTIIIVYYLNFIKYNGRHRCI